MKTVAKWPWRGVLIQRTIPLTTPLVPPFLEMIPIRPPIMNEKRMIAT